MVTKSVEREQALERAFKRYQEKKDCNVLPLRLTPVDCRQRHGGMTVTQSSYSPSVSMSVLREARAL